MSEKQTIRERVDAKIIKRPPRVIYPVLARVWQMLYFKKLNVHVDCKIDVKKLKPPFVLVSNHASRMDYIYNGITMLPNRMNYVAGYNEFFRSHLQGVFGLLQIIPKRNFVADFHTVKEISRVLKSGGAIAIFPEGMSSINGSNQPLALGSGKFLKHFKVPVYYSKISGGYLTCTKYDPDTIRPGRVDVVIDKLFSTEELMALSEEEITTRVQKTISHDDYEWNKTARVKFKDDGKLAKNLHTLLYRCPKCGAEFSMKDEGNRIWCDKCGNGATINEYYDLVPLDDKCVLPPTQKAWHDVQRAAVKREIENPDFCLTEEVELGTLPKYEFLKDLKTSEIVGKGTIRLDKSGLTYEGTKDGEPCRLFIDILNLPTYGMCTDLSRFYTFSDGDFYEFYPKHECVAKWFLATEELHRKYGGKWHDFSKEIEERYEDGID